MAEQKTRQKRGTGAAWLSLQLKLLRDFSICLSRICKKTGCLLPVWVRQSTSLQDICLNIYLAKNVLPPIEVSKLIQELMGKICNGNGGIPSGFTGLYKELCSEKLMALMYFPSPLLPDIIIYRQNKCTDRKGQQLTAWVRLLNIFVSFLSEVELKVFPSNIYNFLSCFYGWRN